MAVTAETINFTALSVDIIITHAVKGPHDRLSIDSLLAEQAWPLTLDPVAGSGSRIPCSADNIRASLHLNHWGRTLLWLSTSLHN